MSGLNLITPDRCMCGCGLPLPDPALRRPGGADTNAHDRAPQAVGSLAASVGFSRQYRDDNAQLEAALPLCDALYRWARDGVDEGHDWPGPGRG